MAKCVLSGTNGSLAITITKEVGIQNEDLM